MKRSARVNLAACALLGAAILYVGGTLGLRAGTITNLLVTDETWRVTSNAPPTGWNTNIVFDDSNAAGWTNSFKSPAGNNIWMITNRSSQGPNQVWFRHLFVMDTVPQSVTADIFFDDNGALYVNGTQIVRDNGGGDTHYQNVVIDPKLFVPGTNLIAVHALDANPPYNNIAVVFTNVMPARPPITKYEPSAGHFRFRILSMYGHHYAVQSCTNLAHGGAWTNTPTTIDGTGYDTELTLTNALGPSNVFYRVIEQ